MHGVVLVLIFFLFVLGFLFGFCLCVCFWVVMVCVGGFFNINSGPFLRVQVLRHHNELSPDFFRTLRVSLCMVVGMGKQDGSLKASQLG